MKVELTLGSLFDGAGGFPFAGQICGVRPVWASEIEPFPIAVTTKRFPEMKHLGDITKINGAEVEPVDILTFGSPCQDLSVAGKQKGLDGERSGLFMEAIRIIKEMRSATNGIYPAIAIWENVPGAFSSHKGEDFRIVLESFCKTKDGNAVIPRPDKGKWADAGEIVGDGYSVAWRVLDAQYWGVPQRRRRIFLVADLRGQRAGKILFERDRLSRNFAESRETWQGITKSLAFRPGTEGGTAYCLQGNGIDRADTAGCNGRGWREDVSYTLNTIDRPAVCYDARGNGDGNIAPTCTGDHNGHANDYMSVVMCVRERCGCEGTNQLCFGVPLATSNDQFLVYAVGNGQVDNTDLHTVPGALNCMHDQQAILCYGVPLNFRPENTKLYDEKSTTVCCGTNPGHHQGVMCVAFDRSAYNQGANAQFNPGIDEEGKAFTVIAKGPGGVCYCSPVDIVLRRLTPAECGRLQGMPDWWCDDVPHSDSAEYKMWGNGMALPCVLYVMEGVVEALREQ